MQIASSTSLDTSFAQEWSLLFGTETSLKHVQHCCLSGCLRDSRLRSLAWRVLLHVVPQHPESWPEALANCRKSYDALKNELNIDPRKDESTHDPAVNNPLSQEDESKWQQFFSDENLREEIRKDVDRAFPEVHFFQSTTTRRMMTDILFGMVDVLAPILFAIYFDHRSYEQLREQNGLSGVKPEDLKILNQTNDVRFLEHDAFFLFSHLMMWIKNWYMDPSAEVFSEQPMTAERVEEKSKLLFKPGPITVNDSTLVQRLKYIEEHVLQRIDPQLHEHLQQLEIPFEVFGMYVLGGCGCCSAASFPVHDLLFVWDVIFTDDSDLKIVDHIFVALCIRIRRLLLSSDYTTTLLYLMHYPPVQDVHQFLRFALYLKSPMECSKPKNVILQPREPPLEPTKPEQEPPAPQPTIRRNTVGSMSMSLRKKPSNSSSRSSRNEPAPIAMSDLESTSMAATPSNSTAPSRNSVLLSTVLEPADFADQHAAAFVASGQADAAALQLRLQDAVERAEIGAYRVLEAANTLERCAPNQKSLAAELRAIAAYIHGDQTDDYWRFLNRRPSVSRPVRPVDPTAAVRSRQNSGNQRSAQSANELIEMNFQRKKNF
ncbi:hypothetical protein M3Y99_00336500 [Aphelenchoides fujianensis]|nr:hypothetical protein M3Y99_00336500 [Aphelenchoides fujianensis]